MDDNYLNDLTSNTIHTNIAEKSKYILHNQINTFKGKTITHLNCRSIDNCHSTLLLLLQEINNTPTHLCFSEVWNNHLNFMPPGYQKPSQILRKTNNRTGGGGGVSIYTKIGIMHKEVKDATYINKDLEIVTILTKNSDRNHIISSIYRPPEGDFNSFINQISTVITNLSSTYHNCDIDINGDINCSLAETNPRVEALKDLANTHNLQLAINKPTRIHHNGTQKILDIFITNYSHRCSYYILPISVSDHFMIIKNISNSRLPQVAKQVVYREYKEEQIDLFKNTILQEDWEIINNQQTHQQKWDTFFNKLDTLFHNAFPLKQKIIHPRKQKEEWITEEISQLQRKERKLYIKRKSSNNFLHKLQHIHTKNSLDNKIKQAKKKYYEEFFTNNRNDPKKTWEAINSILNKQTKTGINIKEMKINNTTTTDSTEIASHFNNFFGTIGSNLEAQIPENQVRYQHYIEQLKQKHINRPSFKFETISVQEVIKMGRRILPKQSSGPDNIPSKIIKVVINTIPNTLQTLINSSLSNGIVHTRLKEATIIPIFKKGDELEVNNYRPISLINSISKLLEKIVEKQLRKHLESNKLLYKCQFGFRNQHSTSQALMACLHNLEDKLRGNKAVRSIYLDLTKAFDTVKHEVLLEKLQTFGIQGTELNWFKSYLSDRKQRCKINNNLSEWINCSIGVPQGSILGPLLFILYINDLPEFLAQENPGIDCSPHLFADDTELTIANNSRWELTDDSNIILKSAQEWFAINKLTLNPSKTRTILYSKKFSPTPFIDENPVIEVHTKQQIPEERTFKFLGFEMDEKLDFKAHNEKVIKKLKKTNFALKRLRHTIGTKEKICIYNALFRSHMEYGISIYGKKSNLKKIESLQKTAIYAIDGPSNKRHSEPLFKKHKLLKLEHIKQLNDISTAHAIIHNYAPDKLQTCFSKVRPHEEINLRRNFLNLEFTQTTNESIFKTTIPTAWNTLRNEHKEMTKIKRLRKHIKEIHLQSYTSNLYCRERNCHVCRN